jgi:hypothetical protein
MLEVDEEPSANGARDLRRCPMRSGRAVTATLPNDPWNDLGRSEIPLPVEAQVRSTEPAAPAVHVSRITGCDRDDRPELWYG